MQPIATPPLIEKRTDRSEPLRLLLVMDAGVEIPVSLDDPAFGLIFGLFLPASRINPLHYLFCGLLGNKGVLLKSAAAVAACSALCLAVRQGYKRWGHLQLPAPPTSSASSSAPGSARTTPVKRKRQQRKLIVVPSPANRAASTPDQLQETSEQTSSLGVATWRFIDTDSEDDGYHGDIVHPEVVYSPVVDEVGTEADDESSEHEETDDNNRGSIKSPTPVPLGTTEGDEDIELRQEHEVFEFSLTFEKDSSGSDSFDLGGTSYETELAPKSIAMSLPNGGIPGLREKGGVSNSAAADLEPRRVSLDQVNESTEGGTVVTQAIVSIG